MTQQDVVSWSSEEKKIAEAAVTTAYNREIETLISKVRESASLIHRLEDIWELHDFLSARRHEIDGKYDRRESFLVYTLSRLVKDGWLEMSELEGLDKGKRTKINMLKRM